MGSDGKTNPGRAAREARAEREEHSRVYCNMFNALEEWKKFHGWTDEQMDSWCATTLKDYWTMRTKRQALEKAEYESRVYLDCPYEQKNKCKKLGGKWDAKKYKWYVPAGKDVEPFKEWINEK